VDVVAHEICHSWSGNLVTNHSWVDFWLNEGFTNYLERILISIIFEEEYRKFHLFLGYSELRRSVKEFIQAGEDGLTLLRPNLLGIDPDDAFSIVPYEKGCLFLYYLEITVGGKDNFLRWLNEFYKINIQKTITLEQMRDHFLHYFSTKLENGEEKLKSIDWNTWIYSPGLPPFDPSSYLVNSYRIAAEKVLNKWIASTDGSNLSPEDIKGFRPSQVMYCLDEFVLSNKMPIDHKIIEKMEENYNMLYTKNVEISNRFVGICLKSKYANAVPACTKILAEHGRGRYVKYLYNCLNEFDHNLAVQTFQANKRSYHSVIINAFEEKLAK